MKKYLVKLNQPVFIKDSPCGQLKMLPVYGLLAPCYEDLEELDSIDSYVDYLAAMNEWSADREDSFDVDNKNWVDKNGNVHHYYDNWTSEICRKNREKTGLDYTLYVIDLDRIDSDCLACWTDGSIITCETLLYNLLNLSERQVEKKTEKKEQYSVIVFNRPIWLPRNVLWEREDGFCHIYGFVTRRELDRRLLDDSNNYLGYLALCEEVTLNTSGESPGGFSANLANSGFSWFRGDDEFSCRSEEILEEGQRCRRKNNLILDAAILRVPAFYLNKRVRDGFILSKDLYESLIKVIATADSD